MKTYAAYYDNDTRIFSSSGGLFSAIANRFEVVYGVAMTCDCISAEYQRIDDGNIAPLRGSKYLQPKVGDTFQKIKTDLLAGRNVLFTGTCCQVNGLKCFLQKEYDNLTTIDVVCHGVPTLLYWQKYIDGKTVKFVNFRSKESGWTNYTYGMKLNDDYIPFDRNTFMYLYIKDYANRPSCYECVCKKDKLSDITLGDFWGVEKLHPEMDDDKGTSLVIIRTNKGQNIFDGIKEELVYKEVRYEDGVKYNPSEYSSTNKPCRRKQFFYDLRRMEFDDLYKKYTHISIWRKAARKVKRLIKK